MLGHRRRLNCEIRKGYDRFYARNAMEPEPMQSVVDCELGAQTIEEFELYSTMFYSRYGEYFKDATDCEFFAMLPLSHKHKVALLKQNAVPQALL